MKIERAFAVPVLGGYYNEDLEAIRAGAVRDGFMYTGTPRSAGFTRIREPSEALSLVLLLDDGHTVCGDALSVEYSAAGGRAGRFRAAAQLPHVESMCRLLEGRTVGDFLPMCRELEDAGLADGLHRPAALYAASQALLQAVAIDRRQTGAEILAEAFDVAVAQHPIPLNVQSGEDRYTAVDKAILKQAAALPHGLINDIDTALGRSGEILRDFVSWTARRIAQYGADGYEPELHIDVYGLVGVIFGHDVPRMAAYLAQLGEAAQPYRLCIETPVLMDSRTAQIEMFGTLRGEMAERDPTRGVKLIADEWANDLADIAAFLDADATDMINVKTPDLGSVHRAAEAVLACWSRDVRPILGGSCTDTDQSARVVAHVALATRPAWVLARPGMGVDEGMTVVHNEMMRTLAIIESRRRLAEQRGRPGAEPA